MADEFINTAAINAARQSLIDSTKGPVTNKPGFIGPIPLEWNASGPLSIQGVSPLSKPITGIFKDPKNIGGWAGKYFAALAAAAEDFKKISDGAPAMYPATNISAADLGNMQTGLNSNGDSYTARIEGGNNTALDLSK